jgi:hypothetical protein
MFAAAPKARLCFTSMAPPSIPTQESIDESNQR